MRSFKIIACLDKSGGIGKTNKLPWVSAYEMAHFRSVTMSSIVIMGRLTYESIGRKLPHRENVVISSKSKEELPNADFVFDNLVDAIEFFETDERNMYVIGGGKLYSEAICFKACDELILSRMLNDYECDVFFPKIDTTVWSLQKVDTDLKEKADFIVNYYKNVSKINEFDEQYNTLVNNVLFNSSERQTRNSICKSLFAPDPMRFDLTKGFPLLTTKKTFFRGIFEELAWFLRGSTNAKELSDKGVKIWDANAKDFKEKGKARFDGDLGLVYGHQLKRFGEQQSCGQQGFDQMKYVIDEIRNNPSSRRILFSFLNPCEMFGEQNAALPCCHVLCQFYVDDGYLSCHMYQRSCDIMCGIPFNCASYALLTELVAKSTGLKAKHLTMSFGDSHIYSNHITQIKTQINRYSFEPCKIEISDRIVNSYLEDLVFDDVKLIDYKSHPAIKVDMIV